MSEAITKPFHLGYKVYQECSYTFSQYTEKNEQVSFNCLKCHSNNAIKLALYKSGRSINDLYQAERLITKEELLSNKAVRINNFPGRENFGELSLWLVPALYEMVDCQFCNCSYLCIFGYGELQPSREEIQISGIWQMV